MISTAKFSFTTLIIFFLPLVVIGQNTNYDYWNKLGQAEKYFMGTKTEVNNKGVILVLNRRGTYDGFINELYRSIDEGKTWDRINGRIPQQLKEKDKNLTGYVKDYYLKIQSRISDILAVDSTFYALARTDVNHEAEHRLIRSVDNGKTWKFVDANRLIYASALLPHKNNQLLFTHHMYTASNSSFLGRPSLFLSQYDRNTQTFKDGYSGKNDFTLICDGPNNYYYEGGTAFPPTHLKAGTRFYTKKGSDLVNTLQGSEYEEILKDNNTMFGYPGVKAFTLDFANVAPSGRLYTILDNQLYRSVNSAKSFEKIAGAYFSRVFQLFPIPCTGTLYVSAERQLGTEYTRSVYRSTNGGQSWTDLGGPNELLLDLEFSPGGTVYAVFHAGDYSETSGLYTSTFTEKCEEKEAPPVEIAYGTTVITHGMLVEEHFPSDGGWMDRMAKAILEKANNGNIYFYQKESGSFLKIEEAGDSQNGENIILFDWADESIEFGNGSTEAAADALFAALIDGSRQQLFGLENLHFIGHGRGCTVNTLAVERLHSLMRHQEISISQVTNLGPFDSGYGAWWEPGALKLNLFPDELDDIDDAHPDIQIATPAAHQPNNGVISWYGIYSDTYWQNNGKVLVDNLAAMFIPSKEKFLDFQIESLAKFIKNFGIEQRNLAIDGILQNRSLSQSEKMDKLYELVGKDEKMMRNMKKIDRFMSRFKYAQAIHNILFSNLEERKVEGTSNFEWKQYQNKTVIHPTYKSKTMFPSEFFRDYIGIADAYIQSIQASNSGSFDHQKGGYSLSRLNGYQVNPDLLHTFGNQKHYPAFSYFKNLKSPAHEVDRVRGIMNGSFDRTFGIFLKEAPGWINHGGEMQGYISFPDDMAKLELLENQETILRHNRFFVPSQAKYISFQLKAEIALMSELRVSVEGQRNGKSEKMVIPLEALSKGFHTYEIPVQQFQNEVATLSFVYSSTFKPKAGVLPPPPRMIFIDEVKFQE